jgi:hypothetical protein
MKEMQIKFYETTALLSLTHSSETWALIEEQRQKTGAAQMKILRDIAGYTLQDRIRNTMIRNELNIFNLNEIIQNDSTNWIHHVERVTPENIPKQLMVCTP